MTTYYEAPDGHGASCVWVGTGPYPMPVIRETDVTPGAWPDVVARMTGTTITTNDEQIIERVALDICDALLPMEECEGPDHDPPDIRHHRCRNAARAVIQGLLNLANDRVVLAALTGVPR